MPAYSFQQLRYFVSTAGPCNVANVWHLAYVCEFAL